MSTDAVTWIHVLTDHLVDPRNTLCQEILLEIMEINRSGRYVKIVQETWFALGLSLQYVDIEYGQVCSGIPSKNGSFQLILQPKLLGG